MRSGDIFWIAVNVLIWGLTIAALWTVAKDLFKYLWKERRALLLLLRHTGRPGFFWLTVRGGVTGRKYRIWRAVPGMFRRPVTMAGVCGFCVYLREEDARKNENYFPDSDRMLSFWLYIKYDEEHFLHCAVPTEFGDGSKYLAVLVDGFEVVDRDSLEPFEVRHWKAQRLAREKELLKKANPVVEKEHRLQIIFTL